MKMAGMTEKGHQVIGAIHHLKMAWDCGLRFSILGLRLVKLDWDGCYKAEGKGTIIYSGITPAQALRLARKLEAAGWKFHGWTVAKVGKKVLS